MSNVISVTEENFKEEVLQSKTPVLVDFWAPWCGPCKLMLPILDEISFERSALKVVKINIDENKRLTNKYGIRGIPAMNIFINGSLEASKVGAVNKSVMNAWIDINT
jgi:thioredoxin 1